MKMIKTLKNNYRVIFNDFGEVKIVFKKEYNFVEERIAAIKELYSMLEESSKYCMFYEYIRSGLNSNEFTEIYGIKLGTFNGKWDAINKIGDNYFNDGNIDILTTLLYKQEIKEIEMKLINESVSRLRNKICDNVNNDNVLGEYIKISVNTDKFDFDNEKSALEGFESALEIIKRQSKSQYLRDSNSLSREEVKQAMNYINFLLSSESSDLSSKRLEDRKKVRIALGLESENKKQESNNKSVDNKEEKTELFEDILIEEE